MKKPKKSPQAQPRHQQNGSDRQLESRVISWTEYTAKYDLTDPDVYMQQGQQLDKLDRIMMMQEIALETSGAKNSEEHLQWVKQAWEEGQHFKRHIKNQVQLAETSPGS